MKLVKEKFIKNRIDIVSKVIIVNTIKFSIKSIIFKEKIYLQ